MLIDNSSQQETGQEQEGRLYASARAPLFWLWSARCLNKRVPESAVKLYCSSASLFIIKGENPSVNHNGHTVPFLGSVVLVYRPLNFGTGPKGTKAEFIVPVSFEFAQRGMQVRRCRKSPKLVSFVLEFNRPIWMRKRVVIGFAYKVSINSR